MEDDERGATPTRRIKSAKVCLLTGKIGQHEDNFLTLLIYILFRDLGKSNSSTIWVLDIAGTAPQPEQCVALMLKRPDKRRSSTQTWRFTEDGRLCCAHNNMCVQAKDGFFGVRQGRTSIFFIYALVLILL